MVSNICSYVKRRSGAVYRVLDVVVVGAVGAGDIGIIGIVGRQHAGAKDPLGPLDIPRLYRHESGRELRLIRRRLVRNGKKLKYVHGLGSYRSYRTPAPPSGGVLTGVSAQPGLRPGVVRASERSFNGWA